MELLARKLPTSYQAKLLSNPGPGSKSLDDLDLVVSAKQNFQLLRLVCADVVAQYEAKMSTNIAVEFYLRNLSL